MGIFRKFGDFFFPQKKSKIIQINTRNKQNSQFFRFTNGENLIRKKTLVFCE